MHTTENRGSQDRNLREPPFDNTRVYLNGRVTVFQTHVRLEGILPLLIVIDYTAIVSKDCSVCKAHKPIEEFALRNKATGRRSSDCKECHKKTRDLYYKNNIDSEKRRVRDRVQVIKAKLRDIKQTLECETCKEKHPACLQFHHTNGKDKDLNVSQAASNGWSIERIRREIAKCKVLCANCHFKLHYDEKQERE